VLIDINVLFDDKCIELIKSIDHWK